MLADSVTAHALLLAIGGLVALLAGLVLWTWRRGRSPAASAPAGGEQRDARPEAGCSLAGLLQARLRDGVEASVEYALGYENQIVDEIAALDEAAGYDNPEHQQEERRRIAELQGTLQFVRAYRGDCARGLGPREEVQAFFSGLAAREEAAGVPPVHRALLGLAESSKTGSLQLAVAALIRHHGTFQGIKSQNRLMQAALGAMERLTEVARRAKEKLDGLKTDRRQAVDKLEEELKNVGNELARAGRSPAGEGDAARLPELSFVQDRVRELIGLARQEASDLAEKPDFQVELLHEGDSIEVESENLFLTFTVMDRRKVKEVTKATVFPVLDSTDLSYSGNPRTLTLSNGQAHEQLMFKAFIFTSAAFDPQPWIRFNIHYTFLGKEETIVRELQLPVLKPAPRVVNPFHEGRNGTGLAGKSQLFVGRERMLREISEDLLGGMGVASPHPSTTKVRAEPGAKREPGYYLIHGLSRSGKSSVLNQFADNPIWLKGRYVSIKVSAQASQSTQTFFRHLYEQVKDELKGPLGGYVKPAEDHYLESSPYWRMVTELFRNNADSLEERHTRVLFLIDEYQQLAFTDEPDKPKQQTGYYQFPEFIKVLRDQYGHLAAVLLAGLETLKSLEQSSHYQWIQQLGGRLISKEITNLAPAEADQLILQGLTQHPLTIDADLLARVRAYTACHPFLQMLMGYFIFEQLKDGKTLRANRAVTREDVDSAALSANADDMKFIWADPWIRGQEGKDGPVQRESRIFLAALADISYGDASRSGDLTRVPQVSVGEIRDHLLRNFEIDPKTFPFNSAPAHLCAYKVIRLVKDPEGDRYQLTYPLFAIAATSYQWLQQEVGNR